MRRLAATLALACLAGCLYNPTELRETGQRFTYQSRLAPAAAAQCMARNAESYRVIGTNFNGEWRAGLTPGSMEVLVRIPNNTLLVADVKPTPTGSEVTIWQNSVMLYQSLQAEMMKGC